MSTFTLRAVGAIVLLTLSLRPSSAADPGVSYEDLVQLIQSHGMTNLEELLPILPESFRAGYTLMHGSRSLQGASFENPRVILFGADARLTCAFTGNPDERGFDSLECFQFRETGRKFDFRQIQFPSATNGLHAAAFSAENRSVDGKVSCTSCHEADPRPNWDSYPDWPGAYGEHDDSLGQDARAYDAWAAKMPNHPRYRWLIKGPDPTQPYPISSGVSHRPNLRFSDLSGRMNSLRAARILESHGPDWQSLVFAVGALGCTLTEAQADQIAQAGLNYPADANMAGIFGKIEMKPGEWSTQIFDDPEPHSTPAYDHRAGFGTLAVDVAMAVAGDRAEAGDLALRDGISRILAYYPSTYGKDAPDLLAFFEILNAIVPDPDLFGPAFKSNTGHICPELASVFVQEYLKSGL